MLSVLYLDVRNDSAIILHQSVYVYTTSVDSVALIIMSRSKLKNKF